MHIKRERLDRLPIKREYLDQRNDPEWKKACAKADHALDIMHRREIAKAREKIRYYEGRIEHFRQRLAYHEKEVRGHQSSAPISRREKARINGWVAPTKGSLKPASSEFIQLLHDLRKPARRRHALLALGRCRPGKPSEDA